MSREKQIEEMARVLCGMASSCNKCMFNSETCYEYKDAEEIYNAGYRKQSEVAKDILAEVERIILENTYPHFMTDGKPCIIWKPKEGYDALAELKKKYTEGET